MMLSFVQPLPKSVSRRHIEERPHKPALAAALTEARKSAGLTQPQVAHRIGVDPMTVSRWERGINPPDKAALIALGALYGKQFVEPEHGGGLDTASGGETRFSFAQVMRTPAVRARLAALRAELIELGADEEREERIMATLRDRQRLNEFVGGRAEDLYTEREVLQVIDNYARIARDVMGTLG